MTYLPELRKSLMKAAHRQYGDARELSMPRGARRRLTARGLATVCAAIVAIAVAAVALVGLGHNRIRSSAASNPAVTRTTLRHAAVEALGRLELPRGALVSRLMRGTPIELWSPSGQLAIANRVDVYRIWRLDESPNRVIEFIEAHEPRGGLLGGFSTEVTGSGAGGRVEVEKATTAIGLPATRSGIWRELAIDVVSLSGGGSALRVDSEAGWLMPRPASELIPPGVTRVEFYWSTRTGARRMSVSVTEPRRVRALVSVFDSLPLAQAKTGPCKRESDGLVSFAFEGRQGTAPLAVATWAPPCQKLALEIAPRQPVPLMANAPTDGGDGIGGALLVVLPPGRVSAGSRQSGMTVTHSTHVSRRSSTHP